MKKIGILTFHCADNYGAVLQCYAMQNYLTELGYEAEVIHYLPYYFEEKYAVYIPFLKTLQKYRNNGMKLSVIRAAKTYMKNIFLFQNYKKHAAFENFRKKHLKYSCICKTHEEFLQVASNYDVITVGSDQVWSKRITGGEYDPVYFLKGVPSKKTRMSFAASAGNNIPDEDIPLIRELLSNFDFLSTREEPLAVQISSITEKPCQSVMDPVFLLNKSQWEESVIKNNPYSGKKYILAYNVSTEPTVNEYFNLVDQAAEQLGCEVYEVGKMKHCKSKGKVFNTVGPEQFVQLIAGAEFVFTTSFHATALAIVLEKQFNVFLPSNAQRVINLLQHYHLSEWLIKSNCPPTFDFIEYHSIADTRMKEIEKTVSFLEECLKNS